MQVSNFRFKQTINESESKYIRTNWIKPTTKPTVFADDPHIITKSDKHNKDENLAKHPANAFPKWTALLEEIFDMMREYQHSIVHRTVSNKCFIKNHWIKWLTKEIRRLGLCFGRRIINLESHWPSHGIAWKTAIFRVE